MKNRFFTDINVSSAHGSQSSAVAIPIQQAYQVSCQATASSMGGSLQLQVSNDQPGNLEVDANGNAIPVNWSNLGSAVSVNIAGNIGLAYVPVQLVCGNYLRSILTGVTGTGTFMNQFVIQDMWGK